MDTSIVSFQGRAIEGARSTGLSNVFAAFDWKDMLFEAPGAPIERKAKCPSRQKRAFDPSDWPALTRVLGHYSDVQSENSEDTVTSSIFDGAGSKTWLNALLVKAFGQANRPDQWNLKLWERAPHPDTGETASGPEADVQISAAGWLFVVEAKWCQDFGRDQGRSRDKDQVEMRSLQAAATGFPSNQCGVLVIAPRRDRYKHARITSSTFSRYFTVIGDHYVPTAAATSHGAVCVTWEQIAEVLDANGEQLRASYLRWRLGRLDV